VRRRPIEQIQLVARDRLKFFDRHSLERVVLYLRRDHGESGRFVGK
jgi:hypothetical protein